MSCGFHQRHEQCPRPLLVGEGTAPVAQPRERGSADDVVELVATQRLSHHVARPHVVREPVVVHFRGEQALGALDVERGVEMPLALVGGVVAAHPERVADGRDVVAHRRHVAHVGVVEHLGVRSLQSGDHHRSRTRAHRCRGVVLLEADALGLQSFSSRQVHALWPRVEVPLLIGEDEDDVGLSHRLPRGVEKHSLYASLQRM